MIERLHTNQIESWKLAPINQAASSQICNLTPLPLFQQSERLDHTISFLTFSEGQDILCYFIEQALACLACGPGAVGGH